MEFAQNESESHDAANPHNRLNRKQLFQIILGLIIGIGGLIGVVALLKATPKENFARTAPNTTARPIESVQPYFDAGALAGKSPKEVELILGHPTDSWVPRTGPDNLLQSYSLGEDLTVEYHLNRIESFVIFFNQKNVEADTAYRLVGLDYGSPTPSGISKVTTGENWIKVFY